jgi:hypothetical protein
MEKLPIYFYGLQDLENFLAKCLDVDPNHISCDQGDRILVGERENRLIIGYRVVYSCLRIEKITWNGCGGNSNVIGHFAVFRPGYKYKRDLYWALRAWYGEIQFRRLERVFS